MQWAAAVEIRCEKRLAFSPCKSDAILREDEALIVVHRVWRRFRFCALALKVMPAPLRILILEDSAADAELLERALRRGGLEIAAQRVQTEGALRVAMVEIRPCVVLMDYNVPGFRGDAALAVAHALSPGLPVIFVSGTIGEELAVELVKSGATVYVLKDRLERLPLAVRRALDDADQRAARQRAEEAERRGAETLSIALEAAQMGTWDWNIATGELAWSDRCKAIFGIAADEPMNYGRFLRALHPDDRSAADARDRQADDLRPQIARRLVGGESWCVHDSSAQAGTADHETGCAESQASNRRQPARGRDEKRVRDGEAQCGIGQSGRRRVSRREVRKWRWRKPGPRPLTKGHRDIVDWSFSIVPNRSAVPHE